MLDKTLLPPAIYEFVLKNSLREADVLKQLRQQTEAHPQAEMLAAADEAQLLALLVHLTQAKHVIEVGVFTGYTTLAMALALPENGRIIACDISDTFPSIGKPFWQKSGMAAKIDLRIAPALETLNALIQSGKKEFFDLIFIDADKQNYPNYFEAALTLVRPYGLIAIDNTLAAGDNCAYNPEDTSGSAKAIRKFDQALYADQRVWISLLPIAQGLTLAVKKPTMG